MQKRLLCLLLVLSISLSSFVLAGAETTEALTVAVASDLHYCQPSEALSGEIEDAIYWYANRRAAMENESSFIIDAFLQQCAENECDYVLLAGDMADSGRTIPQQHYDVARKLAAFEAETGKQVFVIAGNHDVGYDTKTDVDDFKEIYSQFGYREALAIDENSCSYTANLGEEYRLIALDSCDHSVSTADGLTLERLVWVRKQAKSAQAEGRQCILMMHHNLLDHMPMQSILSKNFIVGNHLAVASFFADLGIRVVFSGHEHCSDVSTYTSISGNQIYDFATTSLTMYPLQYRMVSFTDERIHYTANTIEKIDTSALAASTEGYTPVQLSLMQEGMNAYALGFLKAGIQYRLALSLSMEKIGIAEGEPFYKLVNTAVAGLTNLLAMPLYGEGSAEELAKEYALEIPQSTYVNGWDLATEVVAAHYAGGETYTLDSTEVTILLRLVALVLRDDLASIADAVFLEAVNTLLSENGSDGIAEQLTKLGCEAFGAVTAGEYFLLVLVSPVLYSFAFDRDGVNDNCGELYGYTTAEANDATANIFQRIKALFTEFIQNITNIRDFFRYCVNLLNGVE